MSITLKVKPEVLKSKAIEVEKDIDGLASHFVSIQDIITRSSGYWTGLAADRARKEFASQKDDTDKIIKRFREHPVNLLSMAGVYDAAESAAISANKALSTDVIA